MHVYLREEPVHLEMREVEAEGLVSDEAELIPMAFYANGNESPSFRALLPPQTVAIIAEAIGVPVQIGLLADEPEEAEAEIHAMVGISVPVQAMDPSVMEQVGEEEEEESAEPWRADPDAWRADDEDEDEEEMPRTALLAFAPLIRIQRRFPDDFSEELVDLLETALAGVTKPALEARVDRMLGDL